MSSMNSANRIIECYMNWCNIIFKFFQLDNLASSEANDIYASTVTVDGEIYRFAEGRSRSFSLEPLFNNGIIKYIYYDYLTDLYSRVYTTMSLNDFIPPNGKRTTFFLGRIKKALTMSDGRRFTSCYAEVFDCVVILPTPYKKFNSSYTQFDRNGVRSAIMYAFGM